MGRPKEIVNFGPFGSHCASPLKLDRELKQQMKSDKAQGMAEVPGVVTDPGCKDLKARLVCFTCCEIPRTKTPNPTTFSQLSFFLLFKYSE